MSKQIKQLEMDALKAVFKDVRDMVVLSVVGMNCQTDNQMRLALRRKHIRLHVVKNTLARRVFSELGVQAGDVWAGPTTLAWGSTSIAELSKELEGYVKKNEKTIKVKGAVADGQSVTFKQALAMPTKEEALARVIGLLLSPASRVAGQLRSPASRVAGQIKTIAEKKPEEGAPPAEQPAAAAPA
jgi:large subunit ribosomal protein L10